MSKSGANSLNETAADRPRAGLTGDVQLAFIVAALLSTHICYFVVLFRVPHGRRCFVRAS